MSRFRFAGVTSTDSIKFTASTGIYQDTVDGADSRYIILSGGGADGSTRGGRIVVHGNDGDGLGFIDLLAGASGSIVFRTNNDVIRGTIDSNGLFTYTGVLSVTNTTESTSSSTGAITTLGGIGVAKNITTAGSVTAVGVALSSSNGIYQTTTDGSDSRSTHLSGGGNPSHIRGGYIQVYGNEAATKEGFTEIHSGVTGPIKFFTNGTERGSIDQDGLNIVNIDATGVITTPSTVSNNYIISSISGGGVYPNTTDGADTSYIFIGGGAGDSSTRGGRVVMFGNEGGVPGTVFIAAGGPTGKIRFLTNGDTQRGEIDENGLFTYTYPISITNNTASTSTTTGALRVTGGAGIQGQVNAGSVQSVGDVTSTAGVFISNTALTTSTFRSITSTASGSTYSLYNNSTDNRTAYAGLDGTGMLEIESGNYIGAYVVSTNVKSGTPNTAKPIVFAPGFTKVMEVSYDPATTDKLVSITGDISLTGDFNATGTITGGSIVYSTTTSDNFYISTNGVLARNTTDGTDNGYLIVTGGGGDGAGRGGRIVLHGNETIATGAEGDIDLLAGGTTGTIIFRTNSDVIRGTIDQNGIWTVANESINEFLTPLQVLAPFNTHASGYKTQVRVGVAASTGNCAQFGFEHYGSDHADNRISMGLHGVDDLITIDRLGNIGNSGTNGLPFRYSGTSFTPTVTAEGATLGGVNYDFRSASYRVVGDLVFFEFDIQYDYWQVSATAFQIWITLPVNGVAGSGILNGLSALSFGSGISAYARPYVINVETDHLTINSGTANDVVTIAHNGVSPIVDNRVKGSIVYLKA